MKNNQKQWFEKLPTVYYTECGTQATSDDGITWNYRNPDQPEEEWIKLVSKSWRVLNPYIIETEEESQKLANETLHCMDLLLKFIGDIEDAKKS